MQALQPYVAENHKLEEGLLNKISQFLQNPKYTDKGKFDPDLYIQIQLKIINNQWLLQQVFWEKELKDNLIKENNRLLIIFQKSQDVELAVNLAYCNQVLSNSTFTNASLISFFIGYFKQSKFDISKEIAYKIIKCLRIEKFDVQIFKYLFQALDYKNIDINDQIHLLNLCKINNFVSEELYELESTMIKKIEDFNFYSNECVLKIEHFLSLIEYFIQIFSFRQILGYEDFCLETLYEYILKHLNFILSQNCENQKVQEQQDDQILIFQQHKLITIFIDQFLGKYQTYENTKTNQNPHYFQQINSQIIKFYVETYQLLTIDLMPISDPTLEMINNLLKCINQIQKTDSQKVSLNTINNNINFNKEINDKIEQVYSDQEIQQIVKLITNSLFQHYELETDIYKKMDYISDQQYINLFSIKTQLKIIKIQNEEQIQQFMHNFNEFFVALIRMKTQKEADLQKNEYRNLIHLCKQIQIVKECQYKDIIQQFLKLFQSENLDYYIKYQDIYQVKEIFQLISQQPEVLDQVLPRLSKSIEEFHNKVHKLTLIESLNIAQELSKFQKEFHHFYLNDDKISSYVHFFLHIFSIIQDSMFHFLLENYDEWNEHIIINFMDPEAYKLQPSNKKDRTIIIKQDLEISQLGHILDLYSIFCNLNITRVKINKAVLMTVDKYCNSLKEKLFDKMVNYFYCLADIQFDPKDFSQPIENLIKENDLQIEGHHAIKLLWYLVVKNNQNIEIYSSLIKKINTESFYKLQNIQQFTLPYILKNVIETELPEIKFEIEEKVYQQMKIIFEQNNFYQKNSNFLIFIEHFLKKFGYEYKKKAMASIFQFHFSLGQNNDIAIILDRNCYRGQSKDEIGIISIIRRILRKQKVKVRIFEFYELKKIDRRHLKHQYLKQKLKKVAQDPEIIQKKYYYNY